VHLQERLACRFGESIITTNPPPNIVDKDKCGPRFVAHFITAKRADSVSLYRLEKHCARIGVPITGSRPGAVSPGSGAAVADRATAH
jgi:hypothetical protein